MINSCHTLCDTTYQSCFDGCGDNTCRADCLATKNTCDSNCAATDYAGNVHNFLWGGSLYEPETDLYWMRNRYYHIDMHRFINQDPRGEVIRPDCSELFDFSRYFSTNDEADSRSLFVEEAGEKEPKSGQCNKFEDGLLCPIIWGDANNLGNGFAYVAGMVIEASDPTGLDAETETNAGSWVSSSAGEAFSMLMNANSVKAPGVVGFAAQAIGLGVAASVELSSNGVSMESVTLSGTSALLSVVMGPAGIAVGFGGMLLDHLTKITPSKDDVKIANAIGVNGSEYKKFRTDDYNETMGRESKSGNRSADSFGKDNGARTSYYEAKVGDKVVGEIVEYGNGERKIFVSDGKGGVKAYVLQNKNDGKGDYY